MRSKDRQKMCTQCDGRIPYDTDLCPYCASDQSKTTPLGFSVKELNHQSLQDSLTAPYTPSYTAKTFPPQTPSVNPIKSANQIMPEKKMHLGSSSSMGIPQIPTPLAEETAVKEIKSPFMPILLMSIAGNLLTIGLLQLLFSERGFLRLEWDSSYWFLYCLGALPLFYLGFKKAGQLRD